MNIRVAGLQMGAVGSKAQNVAKAREIAETLKKWIEEGTFTLHEPAMTLPGPAQ